MIHAMHNDVENICLYLLNCGKLLSSVALFSGSQVRGFSSCTPYKLTPRTWHVSLNQKASNVSAFLLYLFDMYIDKRITKHYLCYLRYNVFERMHACCLGNPDTFEAGVNVIALCVFN